MTTAYKSPHLTTKSAARMPSIKIYYLAALFILTIVASATYSEIRKLSLQQESSTALIETSGHQRSLSLNVMLVATRLVNEPITTERAALQANLSDLTNQMAAAHAHLINGMVQNNLPYILSPFMKSQYFDGPQALDKQVRAYLLWASHLSTAPVSDITVNHPDYIALLKAQPDLLTSLEGAVAQYILETSTRTAQAKQQELIFLCAALGMLGVFMGYVFSTTQRSVRSDQLRLLSEIEMHRQAQQILLRNETLHRLLASNLPNTAVLLFDHDMRYLVVEGTILAAAGYVKENAEGKTLYDVTVPEISQKFAPVYQAALDGIESDLEHTSTRGLTYHIHAVPVRTDQGRIVAGMLTMEDITERKHAEEQLLERKHFIQQIAATVPDLIYIYDMKEHRNIYSNREIGEVIGYSMDEILSMGSTFMLHTMHPDDVTRFPDHVQKLSQTGEGDSLEFEYRMRSTQDTWHWFNSRDTVFSRDTDGTVTQILGVARDINQRKQTEDVLKEREHFIQQIAAAVPDIVYIYDLALRANVYANRAFGEAIGYDPDTILAMGDNFIQKTMHPDDWAHFLEHFAKLEQVADNTVVEFEYRMKTPQGGWCWLNSRDIVFMRAVDGQVMQVLGVARDITEWKTAQDALQESEERFRQIAETVRSAFWVISADSRQAFYMSPAYETIWGQSTLEFYANPLSCTYAIHPEDRNRVLQERDRGLSSGTYNAEYRIIRPDGTIRWINSRAYPVKNQHGDVERVIGVSDDITERKEFEKQAFTIAVEREHIRMLSTFIQDTSHDLRTPLTIMTTSLYLLRKLTDPEKQAERIDQIEKQMQHLNQIIGDLHEMSKLDTTSQLQIGKVDVNRLIQDLCIHYQTTILKKDQILEFSAGANLPVIQADGEQVTNALMNLIDNAILYTGVGGTITIHTAQDNTHVIVAVGDTGIGIAPENHQRIFDRFYKVDAARTSGRGGPGLGLSMVKRIVENHGGRIELESALGAGSLFQFYLPIISVLNN